VKTLRRRQRLRFRRVCDGRATVFKSSACRPQPAVLYAFGRVVYFFSPVGTLVFGHFRLVFLPFSENQPTSVDYTYIVNCCSLVSGISSFIAHPKTFRLLALRVIVYRYLIKDKIDRWSCRCRPPAPTHAMVLFWIVHNNNKETQ